MYDLHKHMWAFKGGRGLAGHVDKGKWGGNIVGAREVRYSTRKPTEPTNLNSQGLIETGGQGVSVGLS